MTVFADLPDIQYTTEDVNELQANLITVFEGLTGRTLYPADQVRLFLLSVATIIVQQRVVINQTAKGNLLRFARGVVLDHMGAFQGTERLTDAPAITTVQFTLSIPLASALFIPAGTRIAPVGGDGTLYFATTEPIEIAPNTLTGTVTAACSIAGTTGNGFIAGQLNTLMDPLPYVQGVTNLTTSSGGAAAEDDDAYRERIRTAPESFSTSGPEGAYRYYALKASSAVIDVSVTSPSDGNVRVVPLLSGGMIPGQDVLDEIADALNDRTIRPLTDKVTVAAPTSAPYTIGLTYYINKSQATEATIIQEAVTASVTAYRLWQRSKLGRDINPSELIARVMAAGALRVAVTAPAYTTLTASQVAQEGTVTVTYGGLSDD